MNNNIGDWFRFREQSIFETMLKSFNMHLLVQIIHFANSQVLDTFHEINPWDNCRIPVAKMVIVLDIVTSHMYMNKHICIMMLPLPARLKQIYILVSYTKLAIFNSSRVQQNYHNNDNTWDALKANEKCHKKVHTNTHTHICIDICKLCRNP